MLGLKAKDYNTTFDKFKKDLSNKELVGVRLDSDSALGVRAEPVLLEPVFEDGKFSTQVLLTPSRFQLEMLKDLNQSLISCGVGSVLWLKQDSYSVIGDTSGEEENYGNSIGSFQEVAEELEYNNEFTHDCTVSLTFDNIKQVKRTTYKVTEGVELTLYSFSVYYMDSYVSLYLALIEKEYDGQTLLGTLGGKTLKRLETIKFLKVIEDSAFFGRSVIGVTTESNSGIKQRLLDTTELGIVIRVADIANLDEEPYISIFSGESNLLFKHSNIKNSEMIVVDKYTKSYKLVITLKSSETVEVYFG